MTMQMVNFTSMDDATTEEINLIAAEAARHRREMLVPSLLKQLKGMAGHTYGYRVDRYEHSLQSATRAYREGAHVDMVMAALLHDIADDLAPDNHSQVAAAILQPFVSEEAHWVVRHHGVFQTYHYGDAMGIPKSGRDRYRDSPFFDSCAHFCAAWDAVSFDPDYDSLPLEFFVPMIEEVFSREPKVWGDPDLELNADTDS